MISEVLLYLLMITCMLIRVSSKEVKWTVRDASPKLGQDLTLFCKVDNCTVNEIIKGWRGGPDDKVLMVNSGISTDKTKYSTSIDKHGFILTILNLTVKDLNVSYECSCGFDIDKHILYIEDPYNLYIEDPYKVDNLNKSTNGTNYVGIKDADDIVFYIVIPSILVIALIIVIVVCNRHWLWRRLKAEVNSQNVTDPLLETTHVDSNPRQSADSTSTTVHKDSNQRQSSDEVNSQNVTDPLLETTHVDSNPRQSADSTSTTVHKDSNQRQSSDEDVTTSFKQDLDTDYDNLKNKEIGGGKVSYLTTFSNLRTPSPESQTSAASYYSAGFPSIVEKIDADARSIYVGNVEYGATTEELEQHFHSCGSVNRVTILCDKFTGHPKGFAYVEFADKNSLTTAQALDDSLFRGRQIKVTGKRTNRPGISSTDRRPRGGRGGYERFISSPVGYDTPSRPRGRFGRFGRATYYSPY